MKKLWQARVSLKKKQNVFWISDCMSLETRWSEPALLSLAEVLEYTLEEHGEQQYKKLRKQVMDAVRKISITPYLTSIEPISEKVGIELRGYLVISKIKNFFICTMLFESCLQRYE